MWKWSEPKIDLGIRLCMGKVLGTPRHPLKNDYLPLSVFFFCLEWMLVLIRHKCPNFRQAIYQEWYMQTNFIWFCLDSLFHFSYLFVFFKVSSKSMVECTWNPNIECWDCERQRNRLYEVAAIHHCEHTLDPSISRGPPRGVSGFSLPFE